MLRRNKVAPTQQKPKQTPSSSITHMHSSRVNQVVKKGNAGTYMHSSQVEKLAKQAKERQKAREKKQKQSQATK